MTRAQERTYRAFIKDALEWRHWLNCVERNEDLTREDRGELLSLRPLSDACVRFAYMLRRTIWREWAQQRKEERKRKRAAEKRKQHRERTHKKTR